MPADEVNHGADVGESRARTGPRHAAPKKPLFTRFHMPAGKAIATVAMPTAVLVGMGFTSSLALADNNSHPKSGTTASSSETTPMSPEEYKKCVEALEKSKDDSSPEPSDSASATDSAKDKDGKNDEDGKDAKGSEKGDGKGDGKDGAAEGRTPAPSTTASTGPAGTEDTEKQPATGTHSSPDSGSDDKGAPQAPATTSSSPSAPVKNGGLLGTIGDVLGDILTGGKKQSPAASPSPTATSSADATKKDLDGKGLGKTASDTVEDTTKKVTDTVGGAVKGVTDAASGAAGDAGDAVKDVTDAKDAKDKAQDAKDKADEAKDKAEDATSSPSPSTSAGASESPAPADCPAAATDDQGGVDNKMPLADDPWYLDASSLLLKGASYKGVVEVRTANGTVKKVLKYVISAGTDIGDLHQTVKDKDAGKTYHVQAAKGSTSTIRDGDTIMYTESLSGNLLGLIPVTFSPDNPPPLDIPLIYFTKVHVVQAAQFGGTLTIPGMHLYTTD
ncbi:hypothetical protein CF54_05005 [Streptomyces sp. Tu 6176]|nr:hypothetical protein CF54_05005 [Streptomyces sp. Tu 6176]